VHQSIRLAHESIPLVHQSIPLGHQRVPLLYQSIPYANQQCTSQNPWKTIIFIENHYLLNVQIPTYFNFWHNSTWFWCVSKCQLCSTFTCYGKIRHTRGQEWNGRKCTVSIVTSFCVAVLNGLCVMCETPVLMSSANYFDSWWIKNNWHIFLHTKHTTVYRDQWKTIMAKMIHGTLFWYCFQIGLMFCWAGYKLFRAPSKGLKWHLGHRSILSHQNTGSKSGMITDKIIVFHGIWLVPHHTTKT
jgi:hypothetical protein